MRKLIKQSTFLCFSPPVMIATFFIEIGLIIWTLIVRPRTMAVRLSALLILSLATFQLAEYGICESLGFSADIWAKIGFASITMLPPLGLHLVHVIAGKTGRRSVALAYIAALAWILTFAFSSIMSGSVCSGNYVIFHISDPQEFYYYVFYDAVLVYTVLLAYKFATASKVRKIKQALRTLAFGYLCFMVPSVLVRVFLVDNAETSSTLPSIMCGFAVILAAILATSVLPRIQKQSKK